MTPKQTSIGTSEEYYSINEVADKLKVAYLTVYRWIQSSKFPAYKLGKQYRISKVDFEKYVQSYKVNKKQ